MEKIISMNCSTPEKSEDSVDNDCPICLEQLLDRKFELGCGCTFHSSQCLILYIQACLNNGQFIINTASGDHIRGIKCPSSVLNGSKQCKINRPPITMCENVVECAIAKKPIYIISADEFNHLHTINCITMELMSRIQSLLFQTQQVIQTPSEEEDRSGLLATDGFILATSKVCPTCEVPVTHFHGHACHHIVPGGGCPNCQKPFCYKCLSTGEENYRATGQPAICQCAGWSTFCEDNAIYDNLELEPYPKDRRCGCAICNECSAGNPCEQCDGDCVVCRGMVPRGPTSLDPSDIASFCEALQDCERRQAAMSFEYDQDEDEIMNDPLLLSVMNGRYDDFAAAVREMNQFDANITYYGQFNGNTLLQIACDNFIDHGTTRIARMLLNRYHADCSAIADDYGKTALEYALNSVSHAKYIYNSARNQHLIRETNIQVLGMALNPWQQLITEMFDTVGPSLIEFKIRGNHSIFSHESIIEDPLMFINLYQRSNTTSWMNHQSGLINNVCRCLLRFCQSQLHNLSVMINVLTTLTDIMISILDHISKQNMQPSRDIISRVVVDLFDVLKSLHQASVNRLSSNLQQHGEDDIVKSSLLLILQNIFNKVDILKFHDLFSLQFRDGSYLVPLFRWASRHPELLLEIVVRFDYFDLQHVATKSLFEWLIKQMFVAIEKNSLMMQEKIQYLLNIIVYSNMKDSKSVGAIISGNSIRTLCISFQILEPWFEVSKLLNIALMEDRTALLRLTLHDEKDTIKSKVNKNSSTSMKASSQQPLICYLAGSSTSFDFLSFIDWKSITQSVFLEIFHTVVLSWREQTIDEDIHSTSVQSHTKNMQVHILTEMMDKAYHYISIQDLIHSLSMQVTLKGSQLAKLIIDKMNRDHNGIETLFVEINRRMCLQLCAVVTNHPDILEYLLNNSNIRAFIYKDPIALLFNLRGYRNIEATTLTITAFQQLFQSQGNWISKLLVSDDKKKHCVIADIFLGYNEGYYHDNLIDEILERLDKVDLEDLTVNPFGAIAIPFIVWCLESNQILIQKALTKFPINLWSSNCIELFFKRLKNIYDQGNNNQHNKDKVLQLLNNKILIPSLDWTVKYKVPLLLWVCCGLKNVSMSFRHCLYSVIVRLNRDTHDDDDDKDENKILCDLLNRIVTFYRQNRGNTKLCCGNDGYIVIEELLQYILQNHRKPENIFLCQSSPSLWNKLYSSTSTLPIIEKMLSQCNEQCGHWRLAHDSNGNTPLHYLFSQRDVGGDIYDILFPMTTPGTTIDSLSDIYYPIEWMKGINVDWSSCVNDKGDTILHILFSKTSSTIILKYFEKYIMPRIVFVDDSKSILSVVEYNWMKQNHNGDSIFHILALHNHYDIFVFILNLLNEKQMKCNCNDNGNMRCAHIVLESFLTLKNYNGDSFLQIIANKHPQVLREWAISAIKYPSLMNSSEDELKATLRELLIQTSKVKDSIELIKQATTVQDRNRHCDKVLSALGSIHCFLEQSDLVFLWIDSDNESTKTFVEILFEYADSHLIARFINLMKACKFTEHQELRLPFQRLMPFMMNRTLFTKQMIDDIILLFPSH